jgi:SAM-dependent methyltransferase
VAEFIEVAPMNPLATLYRWFEIPPKLVVTREVMRRPGARLLDVGCGNHSPAITKRYFPQSVYHALDSSRWNRDARDDGLIDRFFDLDLEDVDRLDQIEDGYYDAVICNHVLEHVSDPYRAAGRLARKLRPGGVMFIEVPSERSLKLPRAIDGWMGIRGCLNFHDDVTHRTMVDLEKLRTILQADGYACTSPRYRFWLRRVVFLPAYVIAGLLMRGYVPASVVWDVTGFAKYIVVRRYP